MQRLLNPSSDILNYWVVPTLLNPSCGEVELNDTTAQAQLASFPGTIICGELTATDVADTYRFDLSATGGFVAEVFESPGAATTCESNQLTSKLEVFDDLGNLLLTDTTGGRGSCSRMATPANPGTYFMRVSDASSAATGFPYCISFQFQ